ncbi:MAG: rod shape-determining protein MreD [Deltaproteobacteria bacterium]|nr:rod shape-determining protein MreD [Deltaproteobacteria bacterium]
MRYYLLIIIWTIAWLVAETTLLKSVPGHNLHIDIIFLTIMAFGFMKEWREALIPVILIGFIADAVSAAPFGVFTVTYIATLAAIRAATSTIYLQSHLARFVWVTVASALAISLKAGIISLIYKNHVFMLTAFWNFIPQSVFNAVLGLAVIPIFREYLNLTWEKIVRPSGLVLR